MEKKDSIIKRNLAISPHMTKHKEELKVKKWEVKESRIFQFPRIKLISCVIV